MVDFPKNFNRDPPRFSGNTPVGPISPDDKPNKGKLAGILIGEIITLRDAYTSTYRILKEMEKEMSEDSLYKAAVSMEEIIREAPEERRILEDKLRQLEKQGVSLPDFMLDNFRQELTDYENLARRYLQRLDTS